ncbi:MAG: hypothetical protein E7773_10235 [Sphingomonas sp.]|uniref:hypothetical protein n=1 Tax=Sphingomonas sp. TaxID=28214 RepID=UPI001227BA0B|nr:hypothetical protein [Sphingomonas sp.]THD35716.1 MAG: hypothetical protein E7773_10235 [Sphingomonas sp.]
MPVDPTRAALVTREHQYSIYQDTSVLSRWPNSQPIVLDTNLDATAGDALASATFAASSAGAKVFQVTVEGGAFLEDFADSPPRFTVYFDNHPAAGSGNTYTVIGVQIDPLADRTIYTVRG